MGNFQNKRFGKAQHLDVDEATSISQEKGLAAHEVLETIEPIMEFCPEGWDQRVEDYYRGRMMYEEEEIHLLDHLFACRHCSEHLSFLESILSSLEQINREKIH